MDLVERVAFAFAEADVNPDSRMSAAQLMAGGYGDKARDIARAIIPIIMEEAAELADKAGDHLERPLEAIGCSRAAAAIRARGLHL